jgi:hypothetical protein
VTNKKQISRAPSSLLLFVAKAGDHELQPYRFHPLRVGIDGGD